MASITRGTTPEITCTVAGIDLTGYSCYLTIGRREKSPWLTADNTQMTLELVGEDSKLTYRLTQEQTLACGTGSAMIQLRCIKDGLAVASGIGEIEVDGIIKDGEITDEYDA